MLCTPYTVSIFLFKTPIKHRIRVISAACDLSDCLDYSQLYHMMAMYDNQKVCYTLASSATVSFLHQLVS